MLRISPQEQALIERLRQTGAPAVLVINKIDTVDKSKLLEVMAVYSAAYDFDSILPISARTGEGLDELLAELDKYAVEGPHLFPDDMITDQPERQICAELVREKLLKCLDKEIPHGTDIEDCMGTKVYLQTWVKVKENWRDSMASLRNFGFTQDN